MFPRLHHFFSLAFRMVQLWTRTKFSMRSKSRFHIDINLEVLVKLDFKQKRYKKNEEYQKEK